MKLIDGGLEDMDRLEDKLILTCSFDDFGNMNKKLQELGLEVESAELERVPNNTTALEVDAAKSVLKMIEKMEDEDDVNTVFHNLELTDDLMAALDEE